ncbi:MAG: acyl carrier protein, partial [Bacteroidota bacterium]
MKTVKEIIKQTLYLPPERELSAEDGPENINEWDSLAHVNIINSIEEKFNISFSEEEIMQIKTLYDITRLVESKTNHNDTYA